MTFNPDEHLSNLKGKAYLEVKWRLSWFRDQYPHGVITTEMLHFDMERGLAVFKASIDDGEGGHAEGHGSETSRDFGDFIEKAETKAIGRALAALGFGTQFAPELEEGQRIVDSPVERKQTSQAPRPATNGTRQPQAQQPQRHDRLSSSLDNPPITEQQISSIRNLSQRLNKTVPPGIAELGYNDAVKIIQQLTTEFKQAKQQKAS
jgi:hypothetical protein